MAGGLISLQNQGILKDSIGQPHKMSKYTFKVGNTYKREDVSRTAGNAGDISGNWSTGYPRKDDVTFIFANVGSPGQTGHDYENYFDGPDFIWRGRTGSRCNHPSIMGMTASGAEVHIFWRSHGRDSFTYAGLGSAVSVSNDTPVKVRWKLSAESTTPTNSEPTKLSAQQEIKGSDESIYKNILQEKANQNLQPLSLDGEVQSFLTGFYDPSGRFMREWLGQYHDTVKNVSLSLETENEDQLYKLIWRSQENGIAHAGKGMPSFSSLDALKAELSKITIAIHNDGSPDQFERVVDEFRKWRDSGRIKIIPWVLIARAFAALHPQRYHTTVDVSDQSEVEKWLEEHTDFKAPPKTNWAATAEAITRYLRTSQLFEKEQSALALFPWFVVEQVRRRDSAAPFDAGHTPRPGNARISSKGFPVTAELRHNLIQTKLYELLTEQYGKHSVRTEHATGNGGFADAVVKLPNGRFILYEIKVADSACIVVRQAIGQLLEYGFRECGIEPIKLVVVGEPPLDAITKKFLKRMQTQFDLPLDYLQVTAH